MCMQAVANTLIRPLEKSMSQRQKPPWPVGSVGASSHNPVQGKINKWQNKCPRASNWVTGPIHSLGAYDPQYRHIGEATN